MIKRSEKMKKLFDKFIFPVVLLLSTMTTVNQGVDVSDSTYSLGNYLFADRLEGMWVISTYLSNLFGALIVKLPGGDTLLGANIYTRLVLAATVLLVYYSLKNGIGSPVAFIGGFLSICMCWIPTGILYNYLSYLFLTLGALLLYKAVKKDDKRLLFAAGIVLGINVFVRIPNITNMALILVLWGVALYEKRTFKSVAKDTGICVAGYGVGVLVPFIAIVIKYGFSGIADMISGLSGITSTDETYTPLSMIVGTCRAYIRSSKWFLLILMVVLGGIVMFRIMPGKVVPLKTVVYLGVIGLMVRFFWGRGMFSFRYYEDYSSIYEWGMICLLLGIAAAVYGLVIAKREDEENRRSLVAMSVMSLVIIVIAPLGSNNYTYQNLNNLFLVLPVTLYLCLDAYRRVLRMEKLYFTAPMGIMLLTILVILVIQGGGFNVKFVFRDGMRGEIRNTRIETVPSIKGMYTNPANAECLTGLYKCLEENNPSELVLFGDCPGLTFILKRPSALFTSWIDLDSNPVDEVEKGLNNIYGRKDVAVIIRRNTDSSSEYRAEKMHLIYSFIEKNDYREIYQNGEYTVYVR